MTKPRTHKEAASSGSSGSSARSDQVGYRLAFDSIAKDLPFSEILVVTTLPRGGLQIVQPLKLSEAFLKAYVRELQMCDSLTWKSIVDQNAVRLSDVNQADSVKRFVGELLQPFGYAYAAAAPLAAPVFEGYPGAIHVLRNAEQGDFTEAELKKLHAAARKLDAQTRDVREQRVTPKPAPTWAHRPEQRQYIFNAKQQCKFGCESFDQLDPRVKDQMLQHAKQRLTRVNGDSGTTDRLQLPDSKGDLWIFAVTAYHQYPALGPGAFVFFSLQPERPDWAVVRPSDFQADAEISRLIPSLKFMQQEFQKSPTLVDIAKTVHLSPFHFHRRFTELLGLTPKHFLLECQIYEAKTQLLARDKDLATIAADCGFAHQSHFTSRFKQAAGLTPTRWRRMADEQMKSARN